MDTGRTIGGILKLRELIEEHTAEIAYDFRTKFGLSYQQIGFEVSYLEAIYLVGGLRRDPDSWLGAALNDWDYPVNRNFVVQAHTYDLLAAINSKKKPKPYPAPWPDPNVKRLGPKNDQPRHKVENLLERMNPKEN